MFLLKVINKKLCKNNVKIYKSKTHLSKFKYITKDSTKNMKIIIQTYKIHHLKLYNKSIKNESKIMKQM